MNRLHAVHWPVTLFPIQSSRGSIST